ncbi:MAG: hypothetical protein WDZ28_02480 [Simkaniaceae bacterium]
MRFFLIFIIVFSVKSILIANESNHSLVKNISNKVPEVILGYTSDKLYLDDQFIRCDSNGDFLIDYTEAMFYLPPLSLDQNGIYLTLHDTKLFKLICRDCKYEWAGGAFTIWCPNCGSRDFRIALNW